MSDEQFQPERRPLPYPDGGRPEVDPYAAAFGGASDPNKAKGRLMMPGILIILIGLLNVLPGGCCFGFGMFAQSMPEEQLEQEMKKSMAPGEYEKSKAQGFDARWAKGFYYYSGLTVAIASLLLGLAALVGGGCMIAGRSMFLCSVGALAAIFSPGGFGLLGLAIGIWGFVVLFSEDVRNAFKAS